jgi:hypothetical protein
MLIAALWFVAHLRVRFAIFVDCGIIRIAHACCVRVGLHPRRHKMNAIKYEASERRKANAFFGPRRSLGWESEVHLTGVHAFIFEQRVCRAAFVVMRVMYALRMLQLAVYLVIVARRS